MIRSIYLKLPKFLRSLIAKLYYRFYGAGLLRVALNYITVYFFHNHDKKAIKQLKALIEDAKNRKQPIFVQFPILSWNEHLFQRPQQFALAMGKIGYLTIYITPSDINDGTKVQKILDNLYITDQNEILKDLSGALISLYLNYSPKIFDKYLTDRFFTQNNVFYEYVDHINEKIWGQFMAKLMTERFNNIPNSNIKTIVTTSVVLLEEINRLFPDKKNIYLPNGVDVSHYSNNKDDKDLLLPHKLSQAIKDKKKIIGYFGAIAPWIWEELVLHLAEKRKNYVILMIGPTYGEVQNLPLGENIICTGGVDHQLLPSYAKYFDVSIIPFRLGDIAKTTSPLKLFEYFAIGKPIVVTSDLIECTKFEGVFVAHTPEEFVIKVDEAIEHSNDSELKEKYQKYAEENSWITRAKELDRLMNNIDE